VTENVALGRVSYEHFGVSLPFKIPISHSNQSTRAGARDILKAAGTSRPITLPLRIHPNSYLLDVRTPLHFFWLPGVKTKIFHEIEVRMKKHML